uniref:DUF4878 domain-containing protein n=1 Tax=uncultured bacterium FLS18 TaxID=654935 RepID=C6G406_9BACT|nr:hypothetical protein [uncultured bacterium FLS18]
MPRLLLLTLLSFVMTTVCGCGGNTATEDATTSSTQENGTLAGQQFDTPEAVYAALTEAAKNKDYKTVASLNTTDSQIAMAGGSIFGASFMTAGDENKEKELKELLDRHGIDMDAEEEPPDDPENATPEAMMKAMTAPIKDLPTFIGEIMAWMDKNSDDAGGGFPEMRELREVTIDGDSANAVLETDMGPRPFEFRKVNGSWLVHIPTEGAGGDMPPDFDEPEDDGTPGLGTLWYGDKAIKLRHALAYKSKFFDDPCTVVLLTARPVYDRDMNNLKQMLKEDGSDDAFFASGPNVKLSLDAEGKLMFMFAWVDNMSINTNSGVDMDVEIEGNRVHGTAAMPEAQEIADSEYRFEVTFDVELMQPE